MLLEKVVSVAFRLMKRNYELIIIYQRVRKVVITIDITDLINYY